MQYKHYTVKYEASHKSINCVRKSEVTVEATTIYEAMGIVAYHLRGTDCYIQIISVVAEESEEI